MRAPRAILTAGALAGALDIAAAFTIYALRDVGPVRILQSIASGILGRAAFAGGAATAALGLLLHFFIATTAAAVYYAASRRLKLLLRRPILYGALYGIAVYAFMNYIVIPLSAVTQRPFVLSMALLMVAVHVLCVGIPIALTVRRSGP